MARREIPAAWQHLMDPRGFESLRDLGTAAGLSHTAVAKVVHGQSKNVRDETVRSLARALSVDMGTIYELINKPVDYASPWSPPAESQRLTRRQRSALEELMRSMAEKPELKETPMTREDKAAEVAATMAEVAGINPGATLEDTIAALPEDMRGPTEEVVRLILDEPDADAQVIPLRPQPSGDPQGAAADQAHGQSSGQRAAREIDEAGEESQDPEDQL